jgi:hypothetical protein
MTIGEAATAADVNVQTLRYYERRGLIFEPRRRASGYREYADADVRLVRFIKRAQEACALLAVGFWRSYRRDPSCQARTDCAMRSSRPTRIVLWVAAFVTLGAAIAPRLMP